MWQTIAQSVVFLYLDKTSELEMGGIEHEGFRANFGSNKTDNEEFKIFVNIIKVVIG